jgi:hypothetical protein
MGFLFVRGCSIEKWNGSNCWCGGAVGAQSPIDDLGLVDGEALEKAAAVGRGQAGSVANGAVDVGDDAARSTHDVVMVVVDP